MARDQRQVCFLRLPFRKRILQKPLRLRVLRHQDQTRGVFVQPVDDPRPFDLPHPADLRRVSEHRAHQRAALVAGRRMHHHPGRLVDHQQVVRFRK